MDQYEVWEPGQGDAFSFERSDGGTYGRFITNRSY